MRHPVKPMAARPGLMALAALALLLCALALSAAQPQAAKAYPTADSAWKALLAATEKDDVVALKDIFGPKSDDLISSGDEVADQNDREHFLQSAKEKAELVNDTQTQVVVLVGKDEWLFPIPIVKGAKGWSFDAATGQEELINRRIGRNEIDTIEACRAYVEAQGEFAKMHKEPHFAQKFLSAEGQRDGLYWKVKEGEPESPMGPLTAKAAAEGYDKTSGGEPTPYHGYYFKILTAQGKEAPGGERSYIGKDGKMSKGFALVAWPANYGASGVMTFIVNQQDIVFQRDLGEKTEEAVKAMTVYNPGANWEPVGE